MFGLNKYALMGIGVCLALLVGSGLWIKALRSDNALLKQQRDIIVQYNKELIKNTQTLTQANEQAARVNDRLNEKLAEQQADYDEIIRRINNAPPGSPVDPVVRDTLDRLWGTTGGRQN